MSVSGGYARRGFAPLSLRSLRLSVDRRTLLLFVSLTSIVLVLRLPTFFEPPWHTDEGIFAAVASRVLQGGQLYTDAWESKPPLFLYLYAGIFEVFGAGVLPLRIAATISAIGTQWAVFGIGCRLMSRGQAVVASLITGVMLAVPFWEGNLALTEIFAILPSSLAVLFALRSGALAADRSPADGWTRWLLASGAMFAVAFLLRQTTAVVLVALGITLLLGGKEWLRSGLCLAAGFVLAVIPAAAAFALMTSPHWFWDANFGFFFHYVPSGQEIPFHYRPLILLPVLTAVAALIWYRSRAGLPAWALPVLWLTLTLAAALLTGRPYSHYFLQVIPPLGLLLACIGPGLGLRTRPRWQHLPALAIGLSLVALWLGVVRPEFHGNLLAMHYTKGINYYGNFAAWVSGNKDRAAYERYFDSRVYLTRQIGERLQRYGRDGDQSFIWGEYPWAYALSGRPAATRYATSFYVLLIPYLDAQLYETLEEADPRLIVLLPDVWPRVYDETGVLRRRYETATRAIERLIALRYEQVDAVGRARIYKRTLERSQVGPLTATHADP